MKKFLVLLFLLISIFSLCGCANQVQDYIVTQEQLEEHQPLPRYNVFFSENYLKLEKTNNGEHLIPIDLLQISFPGVKVELPEIEGYKYIKKEPLLKIPDLDIIVNDDFIEISRNASLSEKNLKNVSLKDFNLAGSVFLVNQDFPLPKDYEPLILTGIDSPYLQPLYNNMRLSDEAYVQLKKMAEDFNKENSRNLIVVSAYRDFAHQERIFNNRIAANRTNLGLNYEDAYKKASEIIAIPGTSEHQSGLAIDFSSKELLASGRTLVNDFSETLEGKWLEENAYKYGFILRYPREKTEITKIVFEPWHYRYVGLPHSKIIHENQWTLEEYLEKLAQDKCMSQSNSSLFYIDPGMLFVDEIYYPEKMKVVNDNKGGWIVTK